MISFLAGRPRKIVIFRRRRLRLKRVRRWSYKIGRRRYKVPRVRRRLFMYFSRKWIRIKFRRGKRYVRYGRRWRLVRKVGRYWRFRVGRRSIVIRRFTLKVIYRGRRVGIKYRGRKWRLKIGKKWRRLGCRIRRYVRYRGKRHWLKRRKGNWRMRFGRKWRRINRPIRGMSIYLSLYCASLITEPDLQFSQNIQLIS